MEKNGGAGKIAGLETKKSRAPAKKKAAKKPEKVSGLRHVFRKFGGNPIVEPQPHREWESKATFNPAAIYADGRVHILYRAIGDNDMSVLGYASARDGVHIDERLDEPAYVPRTLFAGTSEPREGPAPVSNFVSGGGGWGGCEDPRLTELDGRVYLLYTAFNGWDLVRIALKSISLEDFLKKHWLWTKSIFISPPGMPAKNACLLPEKINGKYVIFSRLHLGEKTPPNITIDLVDDLDFKDGKWLAGQYQINPRPGYWDSSKIGVGAPPIKTEKGWLFVYQGVGKQDPSRYKIGAMLLDLKKPWKVLARSKQPILEPMEQYEIDGWKFGVVYPCGAVLIKNRLLVYYGGADKYVCVAEAKLDEFLEQLLSGEEPKLKKLSGRRGR